MGINGGEFLIILLVAILVIGPERMPQYARDFRDLVVKVRDSVRAGTASVKAELGDEVDWKQYDPRQYDPRRIVKEALQQPSPTTSKPSSEEQKRPALLPLGEPAPFDSEAT